MVPDFVIAIPSRYSASRLPGKPLRQLAGEPLIAHVVRRAMAAQPQAVWVATDDARIGDALAGSGAHIAMTSQTHASGTDRLAECADMAGWADDTIIVNLQGDEPFAPVSGIHAVVQALMAARWAEMATLAEPITEAAHLFDPNTVKLVRSVAGEALYFSRAPIPWHRDGFMQGRNDLSLSGEWLRHIGIYAYRTGFLRRFAQMPPSRLEKIESLEQLRVLEAGWSIAVALTPERFPPGVDTPEDLMQAEVYLRGGR